MNIKSILLIGFFLAIVSNASAQDGNFENINFNKLVKRGSPADIYGWGENFNTNIDSRPNPHPWEGTMMINHHTGLTLSAHSFYGGIRFYNQGYPNTFDPNSGAKMVMSINNGNVGVGTSSPTSLLQVTGISAFRYDDPNNGYITINPGTATTQGYLNWWKPGNTRIAYLGYNDGVSANNLGLTLEANANFVISGGDVGIGTTSPKEKLSVNGKIRAHEIKVETDNWPDYVFEESYKVETLEGLESYIKQHKHLPEIPSAKEAEANGIALGEMNKLLLKKIEELTLHLIERDKKISKQEQQLELIMKILKTNKLYHNP